MARFFPDCVRSVLFFCSTISNFFMYIIDKKPHDFSRAIWNNFFFFQDYKLHLKTFLTIQVPSVFLFQTRRIVQKHTLGGKVLRFGIFLKFTDVCWRFTCNSTFGLFTLQRCKTSRNACKAIVLFIKSNWKCGVFLLSLSFWSNWHFAEFCQWKKHWKARSVVTQKRLASHANASSRVPPPPTSAETKNHFRSWITDQSETVFQFRVNSGFIGHSFAACNGYEQHVSVDVSGRGARDEALRTSALKANHRHDSNKETLKIRGVDFSSASSYVVVFVSRDLGSVSRTSRKFFGIKYLKFSIFLIFLDLFVT